MTAANDNAPTVGTMFLLMAQFGGRALVPLDEVCASFFSHLTPAQLLRKAGMGAIPLPIVRLDASQKGLKGVHIGDLAEFIDEQRGRAVREVRQLQQRSAA